MKIPGVGPRAPVVGERGLGAASFCPYRVDLLPWRAVLAVSARLRTGAEKYGEEAWRAVPEASNLNHALVHQAAHVAGDRQEEHLVNAACRLLFALDQWLEAHPAALRRLAAPDGAEGAPDA